MTVVVVVVVVVVVGVALLYSSSSFVFTIVAKGRECSVGATVATAIVADAS
jgi:hypothetical protein